jgi:hypothetical protein
MPLFGKGIDGIGGRRSPQREQLLFAASILTLERAYCATLVDISETGARLRRCGEVEAGDDLWIKVGVIDRLATVARCDGDLCEITFDVPLNEEDLHHLRCEARNTLVLRLTPEERLAARDWIDGLAR